MTVSINGRYSHDYKNGVLVKETLSPANETVNRGHYAATTLSSVDADLATANIKNGITLFGFAGSADVHDISDATAVEAEVLSPETFYAVGGGIRTGTMPTVALAADNNAYPAGYHVGAANLAAIDAHLATANIKLGVNIFGYVGTFAGGALIEDILGDQATTLVASQAGTHYVHHYLLAEDEEYEIVAKTQVYDADSLAVAVGFCHCGEQWSNEMTLKLYMDGVEMFETGWLIQNSGGHIQYILMATKAMSGSAECKVTAQNYRAGTNFIQISGGPINTRLGAAGIGIGSVTT